MILAGHRSTTTSSIDASPDSLRPLELLISQHEWIGMHALEWTGLENENRERVAASIHIMTIFLIKIIQTIDSNDAFSSREIGSCPRE